MYVPPEIIRRLDEAIQLDFQAARDDAFFWLLIASSAVALGVILEGPEIVHESTRAIRRLLFGAFKEKETASWIVLTGLLGWILVVIGVAGEGIAEGFVSRADARLESLNNSTFLAQQTEIARASDRAVSALSLAEDISNRADRLAVLLEREEEAAARFQNKPQKHNVLWQVRPLY